MIYLIIQVNYDELENRNNVYREIVGYCDDEESAKKHIEELKNKVTTFVPRYENIEYPYFEYKKVSKLQ